MALSHRARVGDAFEQLALGLKPYVDRRMRAHLRLGDTWPKEFGKRASPTISDASLDDPSFLLRVMADTSDTVFKGEMGRTERNLAFAMVAEADRTSTNPGDNLRRLLRAYSPCLILIDEWVAYARELLDKSDLPAGSFDTHFSFAQALTESVRATPGALLVVSLPASQRGLADGSDADRDVSGSEREVGGPGGREALRRLRNVVGRMESSWRPATSEESFAIVQRRLFQPVDPAKLALRDATALAFADLYLSQGPEFPSECRRPDYEAKIKAAFPIHPDPSRAVRAPLRGLVDA